MLNSTGVLQQSIAKRLLKRRLFYVCRDIERTMGLISPPPNYQIITNYNEFSVKLAQQYSHIILIKEKEQLDTQELLSHPRAKHIIRKNDFVVVFKNNSLIENICQKNNWHLLNPSAKLADKIESKVSQVGWLEKLAKYLPPHQINICGKIKWKGKPFILQFNHSHTGDGTFFIDSEKKLADLQKKFSQRPVRVADYIKGPAFTNNNVVWGNKIFIGNINYQITGLSPFTDNKFATIGNDWALPTQLLSNKQIKQYKQIVTEIGKKLKKDGWKGLYGIDIIVDEKSGRLYLLEINARQPASTTFESQLQKSEVRSLKSEVSTFEAHLASLLDLPNKEYKLISINNGAQIIQRVTKKKIKVPRIDDKSVINTIKYNNATPGSDLIRFQFSKGLMKKHNMLNALGKKIK